nr:venom protein [Lampona murina]
MKTSFAFALLFITFVLISMIDFSREAAVEEVPEEARGCGKLKYHCFHNGVHCCAGLKCHCKPRSEWTRACCLHVYPKLCKCIPE